ncbi:MAG: hypothetical protein LRZ84_02220 [Desertifilum sp.]|nr:hypothetical protein [Desertifilum sp.]
MPDETNSRHSSQSTLGQTIGKETISMIKRRFQQFIALCFLSILLFGSLAFSPVGSDSAFANPFIKEAESPGKLSEETRIDPHQAARKADEASQKVLENLDKTKEMVGKPGERNRGLEKAREHASQKWESLAEKARQAENNDASLTHPEKKALKHVQGNS